MADGPPTPHLASLDRVDALDPALGAQVRAAFERLALAAGAVTWAQDRLGALIGADGPTGVLRVVVDEARSQTGAPEVWALRMRTGDPPTIVALATGSEARSVPPPREVSRSIVGQVLESGRPAWADDAQADARFTTSRSVQGLALRSVGCLPVGERAVLYLLDPDEPGRFSIRDRMRLGALCALAGRLLDGARVPVAPASAVPGFVGDAPVMREAYDTIRAFAPMPWPALVLGETGTGKELAARALHALSPQADRPFLAINCGAIPDELAESMLFGHERGAFTGADRRQEGLAERVADGTLFLDEVGELSPRAQVKLLRLLEEGVFERLGGREPLAFRGRVVAATLRDLDDPTGRGAFREDLFHRLAGCVVRLPPLRARRPDIPALAQHLLSQAILELTTPRTLELSAAAARSLTTRPWPGNVRELKNVLRSAIARAIAAGDATIEPIHLSPARATPSTSDDLLAVTDLQAATEDFQRRVVAAALEASGGNRTQAAARLGVSRQWLHRLLARWGET